MVSSSSSSKKRIYDRVYLIECAIGWCVSFCFSIRFDNARLWRLTIWPMDRNTLINCTCVFPFIEMVLLNVFTQNVICYIEQSADMECIGMSNEDNDRTDECVGKINVWFVHTKSMGWTFPNVKSPEILPAHQTIIHTNQQQLPAHPFRNICDEQTAYRMLSHLRLPSQRTESHR